MKIGEAFVEVKADTSKAEKAIEQDLVGSAKKAAGAIAGVFGGIAVGKFLVGAIDQASRLQQAVGATAAVFKNAKGPVEDFAKTSAQSFGISQAAARELTSQIGGLLKGFGFTEDAAAKTSVQIAKLGADLAATFGGKPEEAVTALGAALRGEFNSLERYGVSLNQAAIGAKAVEMGLASSATAVDANAKAQAALALIFERTADAQGQFAREADTAAGAQARAAAAAEDASAKFGQQLLPVYTKVMTTVGMLADAFGSLPGPVQTAVVALAGLVAVSPALGNLVGVVKSLGPALMSVNPAWLAVGGAALAAVAIYTAVRGEKQELIKKTKELDAALRDEAGAFKGAAIADVVASRFEKFAGQLNKAGISYADLVKAISTGERPLGAAGQAYQRLVNDVDGFNLAVNETRFTLGEVVAQQLRSAKAAGELTAAEEAQVEALIRTQNAARGLSEVNIEKKLQQWRDGTLSGEQAFIDLNAALELTNQVAPPAADAVGEVGESAKKAGKPVQRITTLQQDLAGALKLSAEEADAFASAIERVLSPAIDAQQAYDDYLAAIQAVDAALKENGRTLDATSEKGRANRDSLREVAEAGLEAAEAMVANGASNEDAAKSIQSVRDNLVEQAKKFGLTQQQAEAYADQLGLTPDRVTTTIELAKLEAEKARLSDWLTRLNNVPDNVRSEIQAIIDRGALSEAQARLDALARNRTVNYFPVIRPPAGGGLPRVERGGWLPGAQFMEVGGWPAMARLGEGGPETLTDPFVLNAALTRKLDEVKVATATGTRGEPIVVPVSIELDGRVLAKAVYRYDREQRGRAVL